MIHEPTQNRFLVLNRKHNLATEIAHDEIRRYLGLATEQSRGLIVEWHHAGETRSMT